MAGLCLATYAIYQSWYSRLDRSATRIEKGQPLPEFSALNLDEKPVYSRDLLGKPALLMFYRGNWCPFCVVQVKELAAAYRELGDRARIVLISPQPARKTRELAARAGAMMYLSDEGGPDWTYVFGNDDTRVLVCDGD